MPKLSIITVNYNNAVGLKKTLQSVANQQMLDVEHIVIDGASTDGSLAFLDEYASGIQCQSEPDTGVYQAMNKGIRMATGTYVLFLNSGDVFFNEQVMQRVLPKLDPKIEIHYGNLVFESSKEQFVQEYPKELAFSYFLKRSLPHPGSFIKRELFETLFYYTETFKIISDWEFFICAICKENVTYRHLDETISIFGLDGMSNDPVNKQKIASEKDQVFQRHFKAFIKDAYIQEDQKELLKRKDVQLLLDFKEKKWARRIVFKTIKIIHTLFVK
ncbi:MAG: glycosyltransferase involved in cell wall biosynthesis [Patiriisocius sp.]|jgi:glycosyltransferase involved in cell wall biosynthesis